MMKEFLGGVVLGLLLLMAVLAIGNRFSTTSTFVGGGSADISSPTLTTPTLTTMGSPGLLLDNKPEPTVFTDPVTGCQYLVWSRLDSRPQPEVMFVMPRMQFTSNGNRLQKCRG